MPKAADTVEVAYTIGEQYQNIGLATTLQETLENYAKRMGYTIVKAYMIADNVPMARLFRKRGNYKQEHEDGGVLRMWRSLE